MRVLGILWLQVIRFFCVGACVFFGAWGSMEFGVFLDVGLDLGAAICLCRYIWNGACQDLRYVQGFGGF